jgi:hypothetical protein
MNSLILELLAYSSNYNKLPWIVESHQVEYTGAVFPWTRNDFIGQIDSNVVLTTPDSYPLTIS